VSRPSLVQSTRYGTSSDQTTPINVSIAVVSCRPRIHSVTRHLVHHQHTPSHTHTQLLMTSPINVQSACLHPAMLTLVDSHAIFCTVPPPLPSACSRYLYGYMAGCTVHSSQCPLLHSSVVIVIVISPSPPVVYVGYSQSQTGALPTNPPPSPDPCRTTDRHKFQIKCKMKARFSSLSVVCSDKHDASKSDYQP